MALRNVAYDTRNIRLPPLPTIRDLVKLYKLRAIKQLSQNFLMDERITNRIVKSAGCIRGQHVLEVGPGPGGITRSILRKNVRHLAVVEKDLRFAPTLELLSEVIAGHSKMDIYYGDILKYPIETAFSNEIAKSDWHDDQIPLFLIGNLPFSISTRLLINWLKDISLQRGAWSFGRSSMTLTFQKEVAERIVAPILHEQRCRLSVMAQIWTEPQFKFLIPGRAFIPKPDVDVGVVSLIPHKIPLTKLDFDLVEKVMRHIFSMRQKYCRRGISNLYPENLRDELTARTFDEAEVNPQSRSFELSNEECLRLANAYNDILKIYPDIASYNYRACKKFIALENSNPLVDENDIYY